MDGEMVVCKSKLEQQEPPSLGWPSWWQLAQGQHFRRWHLQIKFIFSGKGEREGRDRRPYPPS